MVPKGWSSIQLNKIAPVVTSGSRDWAKYYSSTGSKFIRMTNLNRDGIDLLLHDIRYVSIDTSSSDGKRTSLRFGDILISITAELGKIGWIPENFGEAYINQHTALVRVDKNKADSKFIAYQLSSHKLNKIINSLNDSGAKAGLNLPTVRSIPIVLPPLAEQKKIAKILSTWDKAIDTTEQLLANSQQQKKALMQQLLTGKKRFSGFTDEWQEFRLEELGVTYNGLAGKNKDDFGKGKPFVPYINIFKNSAVDTNSLELVNVREGEKQNMVQYGDIFFTTSSETSQEVGMSSVFLAKTKEAIYLNSFCFGFRPTTLDNILPEFIQFMLRSSDVRRSISALSQGATRYNLSKVQLLKISLHLPKIEEQQKIASALSNADKEIENLQKQYKHLKQEKMALMQHLLTGKRRVKIDEREELHD